MQVIHNKTRSSLYLDARSGELLTFDQARRNINPSVDDYNNYMSAGLYYASTPGRFWPIAGMFLVPSRTKWIFKDGYIEYLGEQGVVSRLNHYSNTRYLGVVNSYARVLRGKKVAVELSGGLDSTIIFRILRHVAVEPFLIGFVSDRYEFRTERKIQVDLSLETETCVLINESTNGLFSGLKRVPAHPIPSPLSLFYERHVKIANTAKSLDVDVVLTGLGGDALFIEEVPSFGPYPKSLLSGWVFQDQWSQDVIYSKLGVSHFCAYSLREVQRDILEGRSGLCEDRLKLWARKKLEKYLPQELSRYAYKASHSGMYSDALRERSSEILEIMQCVFEDTGNVAFHTAVNQRIIDDWSNVELTRQQKFFANLSFCVWYIAIRKGCHLSQDG